MRRLFLIVASIFAALLLTAIILLLFLDNPKARVSAVRKHFETMPNVKLTFISDLEKQAIQSISADVDVQGKGRMSFGSLCPESFESSSHCRLEGVGSYIFRTRELVSGQERFGWAIDMGHDSPIPAASTLGITNVQSAVSHYDELLAVIANWPVTTNNWPKTSEEIHFVGSDGNNYYFSLKKIEP